MKHIKFIFLFIALFLCFFCTPIFAMQQQAAAEKLGQLLNQFSTFEAKFTQKTIDLQQDIMQKSNGTVMIARPGCFRWETKTPSHQIVITNGKKLWVYDLDLKQATEQSIEKSPMNPGKLLSGHVNDLLKQFIVHMIPHKNMLVFQLIPKKPNQQFRSVAMAFSRQKNEKLVSMQIENNMQQTTIFAFSDIKLNQHFSSSLFEFKAPAGVDILR